MDEALITEIVTKVLAELKANHSGQNAVSQISPMKGRLLVLSDDYANLSSQLDQIFSEYREEYQIFFLATVDRFDLPHGGQWIQAEEVKGFKWDRVYLASCSVNTLVKLALGLRDGLNPEFIGIALTRGTPVDMEAPQFGFTSSTQENYRNLLEGYLAQLISYGIRMRSRISNEMRSSPLPYPFNMKEDREIIQFEKRLLTERDANKLPPGSILLLIKNNVVTPLAKDVLQARKIELRIQGEESG